MDVCLFACLFVCEIVGDDCDRFEGSIGSVN